MVLERYQEKPFLAADEGVFLRLIKGAFAMRRKTLVNNLVSCFTIDRDQAAAAIEAAGLGAQCRAEAVSIEQFCLLSDELGKLAK